MVLSKSIFPNHLKNVLIATTRAITQNNHCTGTTLQTKPTDHWRGSMAEEDQAAFKIRSFTSVLASYCLFSS